MSLVDLFDGIEIIDAEGAKHPVPVSGTQDYSIAEWETDKHQKLPCVVVCNNLVKAWSVEVDHMNIIFEQIMLRFAPTGENKEFGVKLGQWHRRKRGSLIESEFELIPV